MFFLIIKKPNFGIDFVDQSSLHVCGAGKRGENVVLQNN